MKDAKRIKWIKFSSKILPPNGVQVLAKKKPINNEDTLKWSILVYNYLLESWWNQQINRVDIDKYDCYMIITPPKD